MLCLAAATLVALSLPRDPQVLVQDMCRKAHLPAVGLCKVTLTGDPEIWITGVRERGKKDKVTADDTWHLGSDGKTFTAALLAMVADERKVNLGENAATELKVTHPDPTHSNVTLTDLLQMRGNLDANPRKGWRTYEKTPGTDVDRRQTVAEDVLSTPAKKSNNAFKYSNTGYVLLGHVVENWTGQPYETALRSRILEPFGLTSAGFGPNPSGEPQPHLNGKLKKGAALDNPPIMEPAGELRLSLKDWATWCREVMKSIRGDESRLPSSFGAALRDAPANGGYTNGWNKMTKPWSKGPVYFHNGSNTLNYCTAVLAPTEGVAYLAVTNDGGKTAGPTLAYVISYQIDPEKAEQIMRKAERKQKLKQAAALLEFLISP